MSSNQDPSAEELYEDSPLFSMDGVNKYKSEHDMNAVSLNCLPRVIKKKRQLPSSLFLPSTTTHPSFSVSQ